MTTQTKKLTTLAVLSAIAYLLMLLTHELNFIPSAPFLSLDMKDIVIVIAGFIFGPMSAFLMSLVVSLLEMITVSSTGVIGFIMNVLATCAFVCPAAYIYKRKQTLPSAVIGLAIGCVLMTITMLLWNYIIVPLYQGVPRNVIAAMLLPVFLPFNLIKSGLNATVAMLLYKPLVNALRKAHLIPPSTGTQAARSKMSVGIMIVAALVLVTLVLIILAYKGVL